MAEETPRSKSACERISPDTPDLDPGFLERLLIRSNAVIWRARVVWRGSGGKPNPAEIPRGAWRGRFRWEFYRVSSSSGLDGWLRDWLKLDEAGEGEVLWASLLDEAQLEAMDERAGRALLGGESGYRQDFRLVGPEGRTCWMHETVEIERIGEGSWELVGLLSDITQRKETERSLARSEMRFRSVWEGSRDAMRLTDADGIHVAVNPAFCALVGMEPSELIGNSLGIVLAEESDRERVEERYRHLFQERKREQRFADDWTLKSGRRVHFEFSMSFIQEAGGNRRCLTILRDATKRIRAERAVRRSEALFRSIWENSTDGMRLTDSAGTIRAVNEAFCEMVGLRREDLIGRPISAAYSMDLSPEEMLRDYRNRCRETSRGRQYHAKVTLLSGESREYELSFSRLEGDVDDGAFLTIFRDVTEARQAEERRLKLERKMLDAQRLESLGILAGGIAHDFNNLLTAILGNANLALMQMAPSSPLRPFLSGIEKTSLQAADLCKQMLAYSGHGCAEFRCISINVLVEEMNHLLQVSVNKQIVLRYRLFPALPSVQAEPSEIQQVIMNLVINASEAIGARSGAITLSTGVVRADRTFLEETFLAPELPEGDYVFLEVADTGCGMPPETKMRIFDPFFTTKFTGRGLGLAAVLGILQRHKGAFKVYSEPNHGTTFKILLPAVEREAEVEAEQALQPSRWRTSGTILVADDEESVRTVAARMLEKCGLTVLLAKDGGEAVSVFRRYRDDLDLVLLDMTMPVLGGDEVFREIRRLKPDAKIILMSGYTESDTADRFAGRGLAGFVQKPFKWEDLEAKLREILLADEEEKETRD